MTLRLTFPSGRFYAHPWGQNPARLTEAEWPPSPWRLLRAIAAAWFQANPGREPSGQLVRTLEVLGRELPTFVLPKVSFARTVHYQPYYKKDKEANAIAKYQRVRHENHFVAVGGDVLVRWELEGVDDATKAGVVGLVRELAGRITYFGRAESVCEVSVDETCPERAPEARVALQGERPCRRISPVCRDAFCPDPNDFQASDLWKRRDAGSAVGVVPKHLVQDLIDAPQPVPDGAAWYSYRMPDGWPEQWVVRHPRPPKRPRTTDQVVARYLEFSLQCRIPVPAKHVVSIAEQFRTAAISIHNEPSYALSGHDRPADLLEGHQHAFYLPRGPLSANTMDRLLVWCAYGFTQRELNALMAVGALYWAGGRFPIRPVLLHVQRELPKTIARTWRSVTPYVPSRHWYRKRLAEGRLRSLERPEGQLQQNLLENGVPTAVASCRRIAVAHTDWDVCKVHLSEQARRTTTEPDHRVGVFLQVEFVEPVAMPLPSFGHSCHFGLGQFAGSDE